MDPKLLTAERFVDSLTGFTYRYVHSDTEYFRPHFHEYYEIFLILDGEAIHFVNGKEIVLHRGNLVFIRPNDIHDYILRDDKKFSMLNISIMADTVSCLFDYLGGGFPSVIMLNAELPPNVILDENGISYILAQMADILTIDESDNASRKTAMRILLFRIFTRYFAGFGDERSPSMPEWLLTLCKQMRKNQNFIYGIPRMIELSGKSREHLSRSVKKYMGITLSEFVNELRLLSIANMLKNSNHDITDIVFECGFGNMSWASELFKRKYGVTMSEYRKG